MTRPDTDTEAAAAGRDRAAKALAWTQPHLRELKPYYKAPIEGDPLRLDQNTNLHGQNPALRQVEPAALSAVDYPSRDADGLMDALAQWHGLAPENFLAANGSDEALDILTKTFTGPGDTFATPWPSYSLYPFYATLQRLRMERVPLAGRFRLDVDALLATDAALTIVATPNNPTGGRYPTGELERLVTESSGIVVLDEAYIEYAGLHHSFLDRVEAYDNLVVMRTFSKAYGLAAMRIGYLAANADLMARLRLVKPPFNLNLYSERLAVAALDEQEWVDAGVQAVRQERERMGDALADLGFEVHPSDANFILTRTPLPPGEVLDGLRRQGILVRTFPGSPMLEDSVRFSVGRPEHTDRLVAALAEVL